MGDCNTLLIPMDRSTKQKISKETQTVNDTMDQLHLIDIYRTFHPKTMNFTFFSSAHGTFSKIDHILGHKSSLGKFKKTEIIPIIFSDHNTVRLEINYSSTLAWKIPWMEKHGRSQRVGHDWETSLTHSLTHRQKRPIKNTNIWKIKNTLLNNQQITDKIKKEIEICIETNENENTKHKTYGIQ